MSSFVISVVSHRGGSLKSTVARWLSFSLANRGEGIALVDLSRAGGSFDLPGEEDGDIKNGECSFSPVSVRRNANLNLTSFRPDVYPAGRQEIAELRKFVSTYATHDFLVFDTPSLSGRDLDPLLSASDLALLTVPSDVASLRSLVPFLQTVQDIRAMPGRAFRILATLVMTGIRTEEHVAIDQFCEETLAPFLSGATIPFDEKVRDAVSHGKSPECLQEGSLATSSLRLLAEEIVAMSPKPAASAGGDAR